MRVILPYDKPFEEAQDSNEKGVTGQVEPWLLTVLRFCIEPRKSAEIQQAVGMSHRETFQRNYLHRLLQEGLLERTIPDKPSSRLQKYRLTAKGHELLNTLNKR